MTSPPYGSTFYMLFYSEAYHIYNTSVTGFISMLVHELWSVLEGGAHDYRITAPRSHPLDPMDRASHKVCIMHQTPDGTRFII